MHLLMCTQIYTQVIVFFMKVIYPKIHFIQYENLHPKRTSALSVKEKTISEYF